MKDINPTEENSSNQYIKNTCDFLICFANSIKNHVEISTLSNLDFSITKSDRDFVFLSVLKLEIKERRARFFFTVSDLACCSSSSSPRLISRVFDLI